VKNFEATIRPDTVDNTVAIRPPAAARLRALR
jgi:hypothetical protein